MWADNETSEDLLGFKVHADLILEVIKDDAILPVSIGVFGDWGSGKSSILQIIYNELKGEGDELKDDTLVLYFNGWVFEGYDDAKAALLETIIKSFEENKKVGVRVIDETKKLLKSVNWMRVLGLGFKKIAVPAATAYFTGGLSLIPFLASELNKIDSTELAEKIKGEGAEEFLKDIIKENKEDVDETTLIRDFRNDFAKLIEKSKIKKLVVIIDDLDRCTHERIIENLEAIKLFLNVEKTAFIIGADPRIVRHAIEHRYRSERAGYSSDPDNKNQRIVTDYLEKLIQIPYNLPRLSDPEVETYITLLFCKRELTDSYPMVMEAFRKFRDKDRYGVFGLADINTLIEKDENDKLQTSIKLIASLSTIIAEGLNGNPRQIKRFLNTFILRNKLATIALLPDFRLEILVKLMVIEYAYEDLFKGLYTLQSSQEGKPEELRKLEEVAAKGNINSVPEGLSADWKLNPVVKWLRSEPQLADVDLRDYFWLSRDKLFSSISGGSLIPPHIRSLFKTLLEYISATNLKAKIKSEVVPENPKNISQLLVLLEKEAIKNGDKPEIHKVYYELMAQKVPGALSSYKAVLSQIDHKKIPFNLRHEFARAEKENDEITQLRKMFASESQISKGLNQK